MHAFDLAPVFLLGRTRVVELLVPDALQAERTIALYEQPLKARTLVLPDLEVLRECGECHVLILARSEEHTSELQSLMRISYAVFCLKKKNTVDMAQDRKK